MTVHARWGRTQRFERVSGVLRLDLQIRLHDYAYAAVWATPDAFMPIQPHYSHSQITVQGTVS